MNQKTRYKIAGVIFAALLIYKLYGIGRFWILCFTEDPYQAWIMTGHRGTSAFWFGASVVCVILTLIPLIMLTISAFKEKTNQKSKVRHMICYAIGVLVPWAMSLSPAVFNYIVGPYALRIIWGQFRPVIFVALFAFALFKLMQTESEKKVAVAVEADNDKIKYYKGLLDQGVISADEFEDMKSKIKKGEL